MKLTKEMIELHNPCADGLEWYIKNGSDDLLDTLLKVNKYNSHWAKWLFLKLMNLKQKRQIAIFAAEQVLYLFEIKYKEDLRPRMAIAAAKKVLENDSIDNRKAAYTAAYVAYAAAASADAATDASAYTATDDAAYAAYAAVAAAYAAYAATDATYATYAATDDAAYAATDATYGATAATDAATAAYAAADNAAAVSNKLKMQELIIQEAVRILDGL